MESNRISVKSTNKLNIHGTYDVELRRIRYNKRVPVVHKFDNTSCDILAVYIIPADKVLLLNSASIKNTSTIRVSGKDL